MVKLKGTTIIEVLVSMSIILVCSSLGTLIYLNILKSQNSSEKLRAHFQLKKTQKETIDQKRFLNEEWKEEEFEIKKECKPYNGNSKLVQLNISITNEDKKELANQSILISPN